MPDPKPEKTDMGKDAPKPTLHALREGLRDPLVRALAASEGPFAIDFLCAPKPVADDPAKLLIRDGRSREVAVVLVSSPADPEIVGRGMRIAAEAKTVLGERLGSVILDPLGQGKLNGLSYTILPFRKTIGGGRIARRSWRLVLRGKVLDWLAEVNAATLVRANATEVVESFEQPLAHIVSLASMGPQLRRAGEQALERLKAGGWRPHFVLMHGDFWDENLLLPEGSLAKIRQAYPFVVIDWPGATLRGYAICDLIRIASSLRLSGRRLKGEVGRHCAILRCERQDAMGYLLAGLGNLGQNLGCFPAEAYARMSNTCFDALRATL